MAKSKVSKRKSKAKFKLPKTIRFSHFNVSVKLEPIPDSEEMAGYCAVTKEGDYRIVVDSRLSETNKLNTWLHETLHAIDQCVMGDSLKHSQIYALAAALTEVLGPMIKS